MADKWEYKFIFKPKVNLKMGPTIEKDLDILGQDGWELVSFDAVSSSTSIYFILKRKL